MFVHPVEIGIGVRRFGHDLIEPCADAVCKGWRNAADYDYEKKMDDWNRAHNPRFSTVLYQSKGKYRDLSSTAVRDCVVAGGNPADLVHSVALPILLDAIRKNHEKGESQ